MAKKRKVKSKGKIGNFYTAQLFNMTMDEIKKMMVKSGIATADQIAAAEIEMQKKESMNNGKIDNCETDRLEDVLES